ncbi:MAG: hypothetical protein WA517_22805 [Candidatus Acidiferrum sp.]
MLGDFFRRRLSVFVSIVTVVALFLVCSASPAFAKHKHLTQAAPAPEHPAPAFCMPFFGAIPVDMPPGGWRGVSPDQNPRCPNGTQPYLMYHPPQTNAAPATPTPDTGGSH